jgi:RNA polymerase sigma-70 factor (ECF subfamily)
VLTGGRLIQPPARCAGVVVLDTTAHAVDAVEAELLSLVAAGDSGTPLRRLYHSYERRLYGFGLRLLGEQGLAEELVQETWVRLWQSAGRFDPDRGTVRAFLFTIARRVAVDLHRRPSSRRLGAEVEDAGAVEAAADQVLLAVTVRDAMESLSPAHREVLELVYDEDLKLADVAERLDVPLGTVKTRAHHALRGLRQALEERGWDG